VQDTIEGIYRLLLSNYRLPVNIGNPDEISLLDFAKEILDLTNSRVSIIFKPLPVDDPRNRQPDISRAKEVLGWEPRVDRREGLKITFEYFKSLPSEELKKKPKEFIQNRKSGITT
jgi:dTDP-glucose 4,6-dehydratase